MQALIDYLLAIDALKHVTRRNYTTPHPDTQAQRLENSAEHSWHLAMACWAVADYFAIQVDQAKLLKMALIHDIGEIDAGDTFLYAPQRSEAHLSERVGVARIAKLANGLNDELIELWDEQETGQSSETKLLKVVDRILPFMLNMMSEGGAWRDHQVKCSQVAAAMRFIEQDFPQIHHWIEAQLALAVANGWLAEG